MSDEGTRTSDHGMYPHRVVHTYQGDYELINAAAELAGFKHPDEFLSRQMVDFLGKLLEMVRLDREAVRLARVIALFYDLPTAHLPQPLSKRDLELVPTEPTEMTEPCV